MPSEPKQTLKTSVFGFSGNPGLQCALAMYDTPFGDLELAIWVLSQTPRLWNPNQRLLGSWRHPTNDNLT
jgi:hypothetical protein